jgi:hypothetical protein
MVIRPPPPRDHRAAITSLEVTEVAFAEMLHLPNRDSHARSSSDTKQNTAVFM